VRPRFYVGFYCSPNAVAIPANRQIFSLITARSNKSPHQRTVSRGRPRWIDRHADLDPRHLRNAELSMNYRADRVRDRARENVTLSKPARSLARSLAVTHKSIKTPPPKATPTGISRSPPLHRIPFGEVSTGEIRCICPIFYYHPSLLAPLGERVRSCLARGT